MRHDIRLCLCDFVRLSNSLCFFFNTFFNIFFDSFFDFINFFLCVFILHFNVFLRWKSSPSFDVLVEHDECERNVVAANDFVRVFSTASTPLIVVEIIT